MSAVQTPDEPLIEVVEWASPAQEQFYRYGPYPVCASGGFGSAKTFAACLKVLWLCDEFPKNRGVISRKVGKELRATTMATFRKICPPAIYSKGNWNIQDGVLKFNNGSEILWLHLEDQEHIDIVRGLEINFFFCDQAEEIDEGTYDLFMSRLGRWDQAVVRQDTIDRYENGPKGPRKWKWVNPAGKKIPPVYSMLAVNPDTELHWIYRRFHPDSPDHHEKWKPRGYKMIFFSTRDNKFLSDQNKEQLLANDAAFVRRYVDGIWGIPEGAIHVVPPESLITFLDAAAADAFLEWIRQTCRLHRTLDHGDASPTACGWWAVDREGNVFGYREYYQPNKLISYHRESIFELSRNETYESNYADPSIFHKNQQKLGGIYCTADDYADGINYDPKTAVQWLPGENNEMGTRNRINEYLRVDPNRLHPVTKQRGAPRLFFVQRTEFYPNGLNNIIIETRAQKRLSLGTIDGVQQWTDERNPDIPDHGYDLVRYFLASRPAIGTKPVPKASRRSFQGQMALLKQLKRTKRASDAE